MAEPELPPSEAVDPASADLDILPTERAVELFALGGVRAARAVAVAAPELARAVELVAERLARGGRLFYVGAGTSGRLGALDAAECPPTFLTEPELVQAVIAGGPAALQRAVEGAEDDGSAGARDLAARSIGPLDCVVGISASGGAPYVHGALDAARAAGAATVFLCCVPEPHGLREADVSVRLCTGPELLAGSTRLAAGTATKLALNAISTLVMARLGRVHGNRMVDVDARGNAKLRRRAVGLVRDLAGVDEGAARALLEGSRWRVKSAVVMHLCSLDPDAAEAHLAQCGGSLRRALDQGAP